MHKARIWCQTKFVWFQRAMMTSSTSGNLLLEAHRVSWNMKLDLSSDLVLLREVPSWFGRRVSRCASCANLFKSQNSTIPQGHDFRAWSSQKRNKGRHRRCAMLTFSHGLLLVPKVICYLKSDQAWLGVGSLFQHICSDGQTTSCIGIIGFRV